jgi:hypothetical protein
MSNQNSKRGDLNAKKESMVGKVFRTLFGFGKESALLRKARLDMVKTLRYVELFEETQLIARQKNKGYSFVKQYASSNDYKDNHKSDWEENHYWSQGAGNENGAHGMIISSYQLNLFRRKLATLDKTTTTLPVRVPFAVYGDKGIEASTQLDEAAAQNQFWLKFERPYLQLPEIPKEGVVQQFLTNVKNTHHKEFHDCGDLSDVLDRLYSDYLPDDKTVDDQTVRDFARDYLAGFVDDAMKSVCKQVYNAIDDQEVELVLGLGHVKRVFTVPNNGKGTAKSEATKMINGPVIEVVLDAKLDEKDRSICLYPKSNGRVQLNREVLNALLTSSLGGNTAIVSDLRKMAAVSKATELSPGNPETFRPFLATASTLSWNGTVLSANDTSALAVPDDPNAVVITDAWVLFTRPKTGSAASRDAAALAAAFEQEGTLKLPDAVLLLTQGTGALGKRSDSERGVDGLPIPLCTSKAQRQLIDKFYSQKQPVLVVQGPPG